MCNLTACISQEECGVDDLGLFASVRFFQLLFVDIPDDVISRNLLTLTQLEDGEREEYIQDAQLVQIQTEKMVSRRDLRRSPYEFYDSNQFFWGGGYFSWCF